MRVVTMTAAVFCLFASPAFAKHHYRHHHHKHHHHHAKRHPTPEPDEHVDRALPHFIIDDISRAVGGVIATVRSVVMGRVDGMNSGFVDKLRAAFAAIPDGGCRVGSGWRSHAAQAALHRAKPGLAARPGHSNHERGLAADLSCDGGALAWLHDHASRFALNFPMSYEPWHIESADRLR